jgi:hypothetical protein
MEVLGLLVCVVALVWRSYVDLVESENLTEDIWYPSPAGKYIARYVSKAGVVNLSTFFGWKWPTLNDRSFTVARLTLLFRAPWNPCCETRRALFIFPTYTE